MAADWAHQHLRVGGGENVPDQKAPMLEVGGVSYNAPSSFASCGGRLDQGTAVVAQAKSKSNEDQRAPLGDACLLDDGLVQERREPGGQTEPEVLHEKCGSQMVV